MLSSPGEGSQRITEKDGHMITPETTTALIERLEHFQDGHDHRAQGSLVRCRRQLGGVTWLPGLPGAR
jgi:hypothetical protein